MTDNGELNKKEEIEIKTPIEQKGTGLPPSDFKIAEIWLRSGQIMLDASENFWADRCRALGVLDFCKDIVKTAQMPQKKIMPAKSNFLNGLRNLKFGRRK